MTSIFGALDDVPAVTMDRPLSLRPWDTNDAALVAALEAEDGHAVVAFKLAESTRASEATGRRAGLPAAGFALGLELLERSGAEILYVYRSFGAASVRINPALGPALRQNPLVDYIEPRQWSRLSGTSVDTKSRATIVGTASAQVTPWGISMVGAPSAWSVTTGSGTKVMIIDTGVNPHEDLPAIPGINCGGEFGGCDDGPVYHGTHVAGSLFAQNNGIGVVGVAPGIAGSLVYAWGACDSSSTICSHPQIAAGIDAGKFAGVKVINMSFGGPFDQGIANAIASAWATGSIVLVAAAGNLPSNSPGGSLVYPAAYSNVIGVSGVGTDKSFASASPCPDQSGGTVKSNSGAHVDLAGPFWALSTIGTNGYADENQTWCGTSMATPHVSGTAALVWAQHPTWTSQQVVDQLFATAEDRGVAGRDDLYGYGLVNAARAVGIGITGVSVTGPTQLDGCTMGTWTANTTGGVAPITYQWTVESYAENTGTDNHLLYTNSGQVASIFIRATATDVNGSIRTSAPFKTNIRSPGAC